MCLQDLRELSYNFDLYSLVLLILFSLNSLVYNMFSQISLSVQVLLVSDTSSISFFKFGVEIAIV